MADKDFRYKLPDGEVVEAFQLHEGSRYQEDLWPDWFNSRMFVTSENEAGTKTHYLKIGEAETEIPDYGWVIRDENGRVRVMDYTQMEKAEKVVREPPKVPDIAKPMSDQALQLAAKMTKRPFEEVKAEDDANVEQANINRQKIIDSMHPDDALAQGLTQTDAEPVMGDQFPDDYTPDVPVERPTPAEVTQLLDANQAAHEKRYEVVDARDDRGLLFEARGVYQMLIEADVVGCEPLDQAINKLQDALLERCNWCDCSPGRCNGTADMWDCRRNSPLAQS